MVTPREAVRLIRDEEDVERRKLQFAADLDRAKEERLQKRHLLAQMEAFAHPGSSLLPTVANLSAHERRSYSVVKALQAQATESREMTLEREISHSIEKDIGQVAAHGGTFIPLRLRMSGLDTKTNAGGGFLTAPRVGDILDALINQSRCLSLGARFVSGLRFAQQFPVETSVHQASWVPENPSVDVTASDPSFGMRTVAPHALQSTTSISRQLLQQANQSLEGWLRSRIARAHALCIDAAAIYGSGTENQPLGLLKTAEIGDVALGANGLAPTTQSILDLEGSIGAANADSANCAFLTTPAMRKKLRALPSITSGTEPLWDGSEMLGYVATVSNQVPSTLTKGNNSDCHAIIFADWSQMLIAEFDGAIEVTIDNYSSKKKGLTELSSYATYDSLLTAVAAFAAVQDARAV